jgi:hypothetical protein
VILKALTKVFVYDFVDSERAMLPEVRNTQPAILELKMRRIVTIPEGVSLGIVEFAQNSAM